MIATGSCKPIAYFNSPNDVFEKDAVIYMLNGTQQKGQITITLETGHETDNFIWLKNGGIEKKVLTDSIASYSIDEDYYFPKKIDLEFNGVERLLFVKRLTAQNSRIQLYELFKAGNHTSDGTDLLVYYVSLQTHSRLEAWNTSGKNLEPNFDEKMSKIVEDCPALANKIKQKAKGYFLPQITLSNSKKEEVFKRIIEEYNNCSQK
jgi:hypothetical protein